MIYFILLSIIYKLSPRHPPYPPPPTCPSQCHSSRWCSFHPLHTIYSTSRSMNTVLWGNKKSPRNVTLRMELPDIIQVPSRSSVALERCLLLHDVNAIQFPRTWRQLRIWENLLGKGLSSVFGSHWVTPISIEPLQELIFLSMRT